MSADYIAVNKTKTPGVLLVMAADKLRELRELVDKVNDIAAHGVNASDFSVMESTFGLAAGQGANATNLIGLMQIIFNGSGEVTGANRLSQLDEFCGRLAGQ